MKPRIYRSVELILLEAEVEIQVSDLQATGSKQSDSRIWPKDRDPAI